MNFWSLDPKIWEGLKPTHSLTHKQTDLHDQVHLIVHRRKLFVGDKKSYTQVITFLYSILPRMYEAAFRW